MMYAILVLLLLFLAGYVLARWLRLVLSEGGQAAREAFRVARGDKTAKILIADARRRMEQDGCSVDFVVASTQAGRFTDNLNRDKDRDVAPGLPVGLLFVIALDVERATLYMRGVDFAGDDGIAREFERSHAFSAVIGIDQVENPFPASLVPAIDTALRIVVVDDDEEGTAACLPLEPAWRIRGSDLVQRVRAMVEDRQRPEAPPVIVQ